MTKTILFENDQCHRHTLVNNRKTFMTCLYLSFKRVLVY